MFFFFQAEDGIRDLTVTGVQTCALPICTATDRSGVAASRMKIPILYNVRSMLQRPYSTALTALGIALVVAVFIGMLALANGFRVALARTGSNGNVLVLRKGADSELSSGVGRGGGSMVAASPHRPARPPGRALGSP